VLVAIVRAILSLDTTAVMLTPVMLALVKRPKLPAGPYIVLCAFVANVGSLLLPTSNLTNILFADAFHLTFATFAARMITPQLVALVTTYVLVRWHFRRELPNCFDAESLPEPASVVPDRTYFLVCVGYFLAPLVGLEPYVIAFAGSGVLVIAGAATARVRI
jgi:arsenical pump membrane protein